MYLNYLWMHRLLFAIAIVGAQIGCSRKVQNEVVLPDLGQQVRLETYPRFPTKPADDYVGSESCRECHAEYCDQFQAHPMGQSLAVAQNTSMIEDYESSLFQPPGPREYKTTRSTEGVQQSEIWRDQAGEIVYDFVRQIRFSIGSGQRGRTYLAESNGFLYQAPVGWYSTTGKWDLSPGYEPENHPRFDRGVGDGCLYCHAGRVASTDIQNRYQEPIFLEHSIGCERCHGPAAKHVDFHRKKTVESGAVDSIVNPAKLGVIERESVCNQCHVQGQHVIRRHGRSFWDFRPGDRLDDTLLIFLKKEVGESGEAVKVVSQVEQMRSSRCYMESDAQLGCISCHDPHRVPLPKEASNFYRKKCLTCHSQESCTLPMAEQLAAPALGSCILCHMPKLPETNVPHTAQTDHRVQVVGRKAYADNQSIQQSDSTASMTNTPWRMLDGQSSKIPAWELRRAFGIAYATQASARKSRSLALTAIEYLLPVDAQLRQCPIEDILNCFGNDTLALESLGVSLQLAGESEYAKACWKHVINFQDSNVVALGGLVELYLTEKNLVECDAVLDRLIKILPESAHWKLQRLKFEIAAGRLPRAIQAAQEAIAINPTLMTTRKWLAEAYSRVGEKDKAAQIQAIINRMQE